LDYSVPPKDANYDVILRGGDIYDGSGKAPFKGDIGVIADSIAHIGSLKDTRAKLEIDASGLAVAPGFINMLSWAVESLLEDGHSESDIRQGVTLEIFGEGVSMGPLNEWMKKERQESQGDLKYDVAWNTLAEYLQHLVNRGVSPNVASFVGATTIRINVLGYQDRAPNADELKKMQQLTAAAMKEGALGVASALIYAPASYCKTDELVALAEVASQYGGMYISHLRSEGHGLLEGVEELLHIAKQAKVPAEIYHFKAIGKSNWSKMDAAIELVEQARAHGQRITADMYPYIAAATGLDASMPTWVQEGGQQAWAERLQDSRMRSRVLEEMSKPGLTWENIFYEAGPENMILNSFKSESLKPLTGKTLAEVAQMRGKSAAETAIDLVVEDASRVETVYFCMSEDNVRKLIKLPWVSFCSDSDSLAPRGAFLKSAIHPRAYGSFARVLGQYVRDDHIITLPDAIRKLTSLPASNLKLERRGMLSPGYFADIVAFDPKKIKDLATFQRPHQLATGMMHVLVNGVPVLKDGDHTGAKPGRVVKSTVHG
jgi:N-acyl-D-amino-acid deacylase